MKKKRIVAVVTSVSMIATSVLPHLGSVFAAPVIGSLNGVSYTSFEDLVDDLEDDYENESVTIEMLGNWNAAESKDFDRRMIIPEHCNAVLNMHGYVYNRNRGWNDNSTSDGELICVESDASLTINGSSTDSEKNVEHDLVATFNSTDEDCKADKSITTKGGTLTGGNSTNGAGGIHIKGGCTVTMNDVTLAGCEAEDSYWLVTGFGGGVYLTGKNNNLRLNRSTIVGCYAEEYGGAIYMSNSDKCFIEMKDSFIDGNFAGKSGGGIFINGEDNYVNGYRSTEVKNNQCADDGGGIYSDNQNTTISGLTLTGNKATNGGALYTAKTDTSVSNLVIKNNSATERGGGIYVANEETTLSSCEVTNNSAGISGGGIYVYKNVDDNFNVTGKFIVRDNTNKNFYISDSDPDDTRVMFNLKKGSDVHFSYYDTEDKDAIMVTAGKVGDTVKGVNCIRFLTAENPGYHFTFNPRPNNRKIYYVKDGTTDSWNYGYAEAPVYDPTVVKAEDAINNPDQIGDKFVKAGIVGTVGPGGAEGTEYNLIRGFNRHQETDSDDADSFTAFYYSDAFFDADPKVYNEHLATASLNMAYSGMYIRAFEEDVEGNTYYNKHAGARQFLADIGCPDQNIYVNQSNEQQPGTDTIGVTIGSKHLAKADGTETGKILVPITVRGGGYEREWASNATLGYPDRVTDKEASGFSNAADQVVEAIEEYIDKYSLEEELAQGNVVFWVTGYSRAGATANLTSKRLVEMYASGQDTTTSNQVFAYTCEAPKGGTDDGEHLVDKSAYYCIHNLVNACDIVPLVAPEQMGFKRYGVDHYIPGTTAGTVKSTVVVPQRGGNPSPSTVTTYRDNEISHIKGGEISETLESEMLNQLRGVDQSQVLDSYFHPMAMDFFPSPSMYEVGTYDDTNLEDFIVDFVRLLQEGIEPNTSLHWSQTMPNRDYYASQHQGTMRNVLSLVMTMDSESSAGFAGRASTLMSQLDAVGGDLSKLEIWRDYIGEWHEKHPDDKNSLTNTLWDKMEATGAFDYLSDSDKAKMKKDWPKLLDLAFAFLDADYNYAPGTSSASNGWAKGSDDEMMYLPTFVTYSTFILQNHYPEVNLAWARAYDNYYFNDTNEFVVDNTGYKVNAPAASGTETVKTASGEEIQVKALTEGADQENKLIGDQKIVLEVEDIVGEAVYYDLKDNTTGKMIETNRLYRGGVDLSLGLNDKKSYTITTYAMSYGVKSGKVVYNINLINDNRKVVVNDLNDKNEYLYKEKDDVSILAAYSDSDTKYFKSWTGSLLDSDGNPVDTNIANTLLSANTSMANLVMPVGGEKYDGTNICPENYSLEFTAGYGDRITDVLVTGEKLEAPQAGVMLSTSAKLEFTAGSDVWVPKDDQGNEIYYPVSWTYSYDDGAGSTKVVPASGEAFNDTVYTATITVPQEVASGIVFAPTSSLSGTYITDSVKSITRNDADGSVTIVIEFAPTGTGGQERPDADIKLTVMAYDMNLQAYDTSVSQEYHVLQNTDVMITAPVCQDELFWGWNLDTANTGITLADGYATTDKTIMIHIPDGLTTSELQIEAQYVPVINKIAVNLDAPVGGEKMQTAAVDTAGNATLAVTISDEYTINPEFVNITWAPSPLDNAGVQTADYLKNYTATVSIVPKTDASGDYILAKGPNDTDYKRTAATFLYSESLTATVNGETAICDKVNNSVSYTFPMTKYKLVRVVNPDDISGVDHGTGEDGIRALLPNTIKIITDSGKEMDADVTWTLSKGQQSDPREAVTWTAKADITLPDTVVNSDNVPLDQVEVKVDVNEAEYTLSPGATLASGTFINNQSTQIIENETGGTTYYTLDGSDPTTSGTRKTYSGEDIMINREDAVLDEMKLDGNGQPVSTGRKKIQLKAYTIKDGKWDSAPAIYEYVFTNDIPVPTPDALIYNGEEQKAVKASKFYTVENVTGGGKIDADGDAVATNAGTYTVTLKLLPGYQWDLGNGTTTDDQQVSFTIDQMAIDEAVITINSDPVHANGTAIKPDITVTLYGVILTSADYDIVYTDNTSAGKGKVQVKGKGNYKGVSAEYSFDILPAEYKITFNLNGGTLNKTTGQLVMTYEEGTVIKMPLPEKVGYEFDYWKGSVYKAGDDYKIVEDHTFEAMWKEPGSKGSADEQGGNTDSSSGGQSSASGADQNQNGSPAPGNPDNSKGSQNDSQNNNQKGNSLKTGDSSFMFAGIVTLVISLLGITTVLMIRRKKK